MRQVVQEVDLFGLILSSSWCFSAEAVAVRVKRIV